MGPRGTHPNLRSRLARPEVHHGLDLRLIAEAITAAAVMTPSREDDDEDAEDEEDQQGADDEEAEDEEDGNEVVGLALAAVATRWLLDQDRGAATLDLGRWPHSARR